MSDIFERVQAAAHAGAFGVNEIPLPSAEQCRAGNYAKGRVTLQGLPIAIEVPQGQRRMGKSDGKPWSTILMAHYGYIAGTKGADGDALDVFIGPVPESTVVWVVNQVGKNGEFDEHKILLGFTDEESARAAYMNSYEKGWTGLGSLIACTMFQLKWWVKYGDISKPLTERALPHDGTTEMTEQIWDSAAYPVGRDLADLIYALRRDDAEGLLLDSVTVSEILEDSEGELTLDALVVQYNKAERKVEQLNRIMAAAGDKVKPVSYQITPPFKQRGTTNIVFLFELSDGQTVSIWMHNPDSTPNKILPQDELVSWRWMLNKKDITLLVAPERGVDLNPREVSRRIMRLAEQNSPRFAKANANRAARMESIEGQRSEVAAKEAKLAELDNLFADLSEKVEAKRARKKATLQTDDQGEVRRTNDESATGGDTGTVEQPGSAVTITQIADIMSRWNSEAALWSDAAVSTLIAAAVANGWLSRRSTTQVDWTQAGVDALKAAKAAADPKAVSADGATMTTDGRKLTVTLASGETATRSTKNEYSAAVVGYDADGKLLVLSAHYSAADALKAIAKFKSGQFVNFNYMHKLVGEPVVIASEEAAPNPEPVPDPQPEPQPDPVPDPQPAPEPEPAPPPPEPAPEPEVDPGLEQAREFLQRVISGEVDFMDDGLAATLEQIHNDYTDDEGIMDLFGQAAQAYSDYMVEQARAALA